MKSFQGRRGDGFKFEKYNFRTKTISDFFLLRVEALNKCFSHGIAVSMCRQWRRLFAIQKSIGTLKSFL